jgi:hypothetical protein
MFAMIIIVIIGYKILSSMNNEIQDMDSNILDATSKGAMASVEDTYLKTMGSVFFFIWFVVFVSSVISAWFVDIHPAWFFLSIFLFVFIAIAVIPLNNALEAITTNEMLVNETLSFPIIYYFINHFYTIFIVQSFVILISLYAKHRVDDQY